MPDDIRSDKEYGLLSVLRDLLLLTSADQNVGLRSFVWKRNEKMARFFVTKEAVKEELIEITDRDDIRHIGKVLRLAEGDFIDVSDSEEYEYRVELTEVSKEAVRGRIQDKQSFSREPGLLVTLYQAVPKQGKMETIIQKAVELGIHRVVPVFTKRCVVTDNGSFGKKIERWQKVAAEAVKQCRRGIVPQVDDSMAFDRMTREISRDYDLVLFLYENEQKTTIKEILREFNAEWVLASAMDGMAAFAETGGDGGDGMRDSRKKPSVALIVGPEGGFSDEEAAALKDGPARCATLGRTILRTETAGMAALAMVMYEMEL